MVDSCQVDASVKGLFQGMVETVLIWKVRCNIRLMAKFSGQLGRLGLLDFWPILNFIKQFRGSPVVPLGS